MPPTAIVPTAGAANANAYCDVSYADQYHEDQPLASVRTVWTGAAADDKTRAILRATVLIDQLFEFRGARVSSTQALAFPRYIEVDYATEVPVDPTTIPDALKRATAEYARQLLQSDRTADSAIEARGIKSLKAGPVELEFKEAVTSKPVPDAVALLLAGLGYVRGTSYTVPLVRV